MTAKELRNEVVNRLWSFGNLPDNIKTLMTDNEVDFMIEVINTKVQEELTKKLEEVEEGRVDLIRWVVEEIQSNIISIQDAESMLMEYNNLKP